MSDKFPADHRQAIEALQERVGRNVIRVQSLETGLKALLPFLYHNEAHCLVRLNERRQRYLRKTLGELVGMFVGSADTQDSVFQAALTKIVDDRNTLVHHFHEAHGVVASKTAEGCLSVIQLLDAQFQDIKTFEDLINQILLEILHGLRDITFAGTAEYDEFVLLCEQFQAAVLAAARPQTLTSQ